MYRKSAFQGHFRVHIETDIRKWTQLVGGGPKLADTGYPTLIEGRVEGRELRITVHNMTTGAIQDSFVMKR